MQFKQAFSLVNGIYNSMGDHSMWSRFKEEFERGTRDFKTSDEYMNNLNRRTDLSQDEVWDIQCVEDGLRVLFPLVHPEAT